MVSSMGGEGAKAAELDGIQCVKDGLFVLLHILVVRKRKPLHHGEQSHQVAKNPAGLAADEFGDIWVLFCGIMLEPVA